MRLSKGLLVAGLLLALTLALHVPFAFENVWSWRISVVAAEYGHRFALGCLALAWLCWRRIGWPAGLISLVAAALLAWPLAQALPLAAKLPEDLRRTFGPADRGTAGPLQILPLLTGTWDHSFTPEPLGYAGDSAGRKRIEFFRARSPRPAPCMVLLHGGGWERGEVNEFPDWSSHWARTGYAVAAVQYRLAPEHPWPAQADDIRQAFDFLKREAARLGIDPARFVFLGRSAGAQLAVAAAYGLRDPAVRGVVSFYGPQDMFFARQYALETDVLNSLRMVRNFMGGEPEQLGDRYASASGMMLARSDSPPALIFHGRRDIIVWNRHSRRFADRLRELGVSHLFLELPWAGHGFDWCYDGAGGQLARHAIDHFLAAVTR